jgi:hypothetical protein
MQGNLHVPFLGGWAGAIPPGYPADGSNPGSLAGNELVDQARLANARFADQGHDLALPRLGLG